MPSVPDDRRPLVHQAMHEARRVAREGGIPWPARAAYTSASFSTHAHGSAQFSHSVDLGC